MQFSIKNSVKRKNVIMCNNDSLKNTKFFTTSFTGTQSLTIGRGYISILSCQIGHYILAKSWQIVPYISVLSWHITSSMQIGKLYFICEVCLNKLYITYMPRLRNITSFFSATNIQQPSGEAVCSNIL